MSGINCTKLQLEGDLSSTFLWLPRAQTCSVLTYDLESKLLTKMQMDEYNGNSTLYEMSDMMINASIDAKVFDGSTKERF